MCQLRSDALSSDAVSWPKFCQKRFSAFALVAEAPTQPLAEAELLGALLAKLRALFAAADNVKAPSGWSSVLSMIGHVHTIFD